MPKLSLLKSFDLLLVPPTGLTPLETEGKGALWILSKEVGLRGQGHCGGE